MYQSVAAVAALFLIVCSALIPRNWLPMVSYRVLGQTQTILRRDSLIGLLIVFVAALWESTLMREFSFRSLRCVANIVVRWVCIGA